MGDLTGTYIWMMFPLLNQGTSRLSNTIAIEQSTLKTKQEKTVNNRLSRRITVSETDEETSQNIDEEQKPTTTGATYFFRIMGRKEYALTKDEDLVKELQNLTKNMNRSMIDVNFRTEQTIFSQESNWTALNMLNTDLPLQECLRFRC